MSRHSDRASRGRGSRSSTPALVDVNAGLDQRDRQPQSTWTSMTGGTPARGPLVPLRHPGKTQLHSWNGELYDCHSTCADPAFPLEDAGRTHQLYQVFQLLVQTASGELHGNGTAFVKTSRYQIAIAAVSVLIKSGPCPKMQCMPALRQLRRPTPSLEIHRKVPVPPAWLGGGGPGSTCSLKMAADVRKLCKLRILSLRAGAAITGYVQLALLTPLLADSCIQL